MWTWGKIFGRKRGEQPPDLGTRARAGEPVDPAVRGEARPAALRPAVVVLASPRRRANAIARRALIIANTVTTRWTRRK